MKYGVIIYKDSKNIGDDIQSVAAARLLPQVDYYLDREHLDSVDLQEDVKVLFNGWFMEHCQNWPPHPRIKPLITSVHLTTKRGCRTALTSEKYHEYYESVGPIGCRDRGTLEAFQSQGVASYYSGCLTLTLKNSPDVARSDKIYLVDPFTKIDEQHYKDQFIQKFMPRSQQGNIEVISHQLEDLPNMSMDARMKQASELLDKYAKAKLVITSRIHCALPCIALGTPVYFVDVGYDREGSRDRFDGILDYMRLIPPKYFPFSSRTKVGKIMRKLRLYSLIPDGKNIDFIDWDNPKPNPNYPGDLIKAHLKRVHQFLERKTDV